MQTANIKSSLASLTIFRKRVVHFLRLNKIVNIKMKREEI